MNICVFGSSSDRINGEYLSSAEHLGSSLAKKGHTVVFGAGKYGVMGAVARGVSSEGGRLIGVSPKFFMEMDVLYENTTETIFTDTMRERKNAMEEMSNAFIVCAGGMGTFEEFFEVLTLKQLFQHTSPIIVYNVRGCYNPMLEMFNKSIEEGFMTDECKKLFTIAETEEQVFEQLENYEPFSYDKYDYIYMEKDKED